MKIIVYPFIMFLVFGLILIYFILFLTGCGPKHRTSWLWYGESMSKKRRFAPTITCFPNIKYFVPSEFDSPDLPGSGVNMDNTLIYRLDQIRILLKQPIIINSGFRTNAHNIKVHGSSNSSHLAGLAADVHAPDSTFKFHFVRYSIWLGICRLFIYENHIHIDIDTDKPYPVLGYGKLR